jgi:hypothetical protein
LGTGADVNSGFGILLLIICFLFVLFYAQYQTGEYSLLFKLAIAGFMFIPLGILVMMISRIGMYFTPITIAVYPILIKKIKKVEIKNFFIAFLMVFTLYTFGMFFKTGVFKDKFSTYQTIFSAPSK